VKIFPSSFLRFLFTPTAFFVASLTLTPVTVAQAQRLLGADDLAEIHHLYAQYNLMLDAGDSQSWADTFIDDGSFNTFVGRQALISFADDFIASNPDTRHWNSNIQLTATADGAAGTAYLMLWKVSPQPAEVVLTGIYTDELVKTAQGWRFKARLIEIDRPANP
jgi:3-phenylpropionate/cinnamic acid dioxygenase small subunit